MRDETTKQAAQDFLAAKLAEEGQKHEDKFNKETAVSRSLYVWKSFRDAVFAQCSEWNTVTQEQTLTCTETPMGDLRIWCSATAKQITVYYDSRKLLIRVRNDAPSPWNRPRKTLSSFTADGRSWKKSARLNYGSGA